MIYNPEHTYGWYGYEDEQALLKDISAILPKGTKIFIFKKDLYDNIRQLKRGTMLCWLNKDRDIPTSAYDIKEIVL